MSFTLTEIAVAGGIFYGLNWWVNSSREPNAPPLDVTTRRFISQSKKSGGGSPYIIGKLKYALLSEGVVPKITDEQDPSRTEAELFVQIEELKSRMATAPSKNILSNLSPKTPGALLRDYANMTRHRDALGPAKEYS